MTIAYQAVGHGSRGVIAVHGWFGDETTYSALLPAIDKESYTWVFPALRGYGLSRQLDGELTVDEAAADCLAVADRMGFRRFSLVGHSMGGKVALRVLARAPMRVQAIVGVAPVPASAVNMPPEARQLFTSAAGDPAARREIVDHSTGRRLAPAWLDDKVTGTLRGATPEAIARYFESWSGTDFAAELTRRKVPVAAVIGEHDPDINEEGMKATYGRWFPELELTVFPNCGHYPTEEAPVALATLIGSFLDRVHAAR